jgi:hypothetical protein
MTDGYGWGRGTTTSPLPVIPRLDRSIHGFTPHNIRAGYTMSEARILQPFWYIIRAILLSVREFVEYERRVGIAVSTGVA